MSNPHPPPIPDCCANCKFWLPCESGGPGRGHCRHDSPSPTTAALEEHYGHVCMRWPLTYSVCWCGKHEKN